MRSHQSGKCSRSESSEGRTRILPSCAQQPSREDIQRCLPLQRYVYSRLKSRPLRSLCIHIKAPTAPDVSPTTCEVTSKRQRYFCTAQTHKQVPTSISGHPLSPAASEGDHELPTHRGKPAAQKREFWRPMLSRENGVGDGKKNDIDLCVQSLNDAQNEAHVYMCPESCKLHDIWRVKLVAQADRAVGVVQHHSQCAPIVWLALRCATQSPSALALGSWTWMKLLLVSSRWSCSGIANMCHVF